MSYVHTKTSSIRSILILDNSAVSREFNRILKEAANKPLPDLPQTESVEQSAVNHTADANDLARNAPLVHDGRQEDQILHREDLLVGRHLPAVHDGDRLAPPENVVRRPIDNDGDMHGHLEDRARPPQQVANDDAGPQRHVVFTRRDHTQDRVIEDSVVFPPDVDPLQVLSMVLRRM